MNEGVSFFRRWIVPILLFAATCWTTTKTGVFHVSRDGTAPLSAGLAYSVPLMLILLCHELGHYFAARIHGVPASLPIFVPLPPGFGFLGTMGAVILQGGTADRKKLIDIGAAGPLAGLFVAIPVLVVGLMQSEVSPLVGLGQQEGNSLFYALVKYAVKGEWLPGGGRDVILHPTAFAGWAGLLVTMLNLLPIGQLDGGHIATAHFGNRWEAVAAWLHRGLLLLALGVFGWVYVNASRLLGGREVANLSPAALAVGPAVMWLMWFGLLALLRRASGGRYHPYVEDRPLPMSRVVLFWIVAVIFVLIFMPVPMSISLGTDITDALGAP